MPRHDLRETQRQLRVDVTEGTVWDVHHAAPRMPHAWRAMGIAWANADPLRLVSHTGLLPASAEDLAALGVGSHSAALDTANWLRRMAR